LAASQAFSEAEKERLADKLKNRINQQSELIVVCQQARTQGQNRNLALLKLQQLVNEALQQDKERIPTQPTFSAQEQRLNSKKKISQKKADRRLPNIE
ncbi:MAG: aminoacyl-tRNA hydrolase, partial [Candidatus Komeilibacteria bacterium]|nr:aminoacyl-tRNA hydrolase [Candidatus Komeilibacteria bacterium]